MVEKFTEEQLEEFKNTFTFYDNDGDGCVGIKELPKIMGSLSMFVNEDELRDLINEVAPECNEEIGYVEFLELMAKKLEKQDESENLAEALSQYDVDKTGLISREDLMHVLMMRGGFTNEKAEEFVIENDLDGDGMITIESAVQSIINR